MKRILLFEPSIATLNLGDHIIVESIKRELGFLLRDAFVVAVSDMAGVMLVFNGKIILGTRARKTRSKSFEAFSFEKSD